MDKRNIVPGAEYAIREHLEDDLQHVKVLAPVRSGKWRAEWIDPNPGLVDYVRSRDVLVEWADRHALLRDERNADAMARAAAVSGYPGPHHPVEAAVDAVLESTGEPSLHQYKGVLYYELGALKRVAARAGVPEPHHPAGYEDRHGVRRLPWQCALELAEAFARAEPATVLAPIDAQEQQWARSRSLGDHDVTALLVRYRAAWAVVRQWAGYDAAVATRERRIADLEDLLTSVMWELRRPNPNTDRIANRIERALHGS